VTDNKAVCLRVRLNSYDNFFQQILHLNE
jgi:hypothetical protein